jgi:hypothetical protein
MIEFMQSSSDLQIKIPWNNYFKARETRIQLEKNDAEGVAVLERDRQETLKIEKWYATCLSEAISSLGC